VTIYPQVPDWLQDAGDEFLTPQERAQLDALFARIWPADPARHIPGAVEVGASRFVSRLLARPATVFGDIPKWHSLYREGLQALDDHARHQYGRPLAELAPAQVDEVLAALEKQAIPSLPLPDGVTQYALFDLFRRHCIQGCLSDPRWGGNDGKQMWRALGYLQPAEDL
jgi:gluconate 2-dehydrogenase gamma chain